MTPKAERVVKIAKNGFNDAIDTTACMKILSAGNTIEVVKEIEVTGAGRAAVIIRKALFQRILMTVERAFDRDFRKGDLHTAIAFQLLADPTVFNEVAQRGSRQHLDQAMLFWPRYRDDPRRKQLRHYRDKVLAHIAERDPNIGAPLIRELLGFASGMTDIWARLARGAGVVTLDLSTQVLPYEESANAFWRRFTLC